jgi:hypothetical protein
MSRTYNSKSRLLEKFIIEIIEIYVDPLEKCPVIRLNMIYESSIEMDPIQNYCEGASWL